MAEYIDKWHLLCDVIPRMPMETRNWKNLHQAIEDEPAADVVEVVHGKWKPGKEISRTMLCDETLAIEYDAFYCSSCGRRYKEYVLIYNYCPNCGAKMDGGDGDATD